MSTIVSLFSRAMGKLGHSCPAFYGYSKSPKVTGPVVTIGLYRTVSEIYGDFSRKKTNFSIPPVFDAPVDVTVEILQRRFVSKTRMMPLPYC